MKQNLSLNFLKDLIDFNLLNTNSLTNNKLKDNVLNILNLNKEFKMFVNIINYVNINKYDFILIIVEDPFLYQLLLKKVLDLNRTKKIRIIVSTKQRNLDNIFTKKKLLTINISNCFKNNAEDILININSQNNAKYQNFGVYSVSSNIDTIKVLIFFITLISNLVKNK